MQNISNASPFCGGGNVATCINDDIAGLGQRTLLFTRGINITPYSGLILNSGQIGDEGFFRFTKPDPQTSLQNGAQFTMRHFVESTCAAADENNLDKIDGVVPMRNDLYDLAGKTVCAVAYDSVDFANGFASLKGATLGLTAFTVTAVNPHPDGGSYLPRLTIDLLPSAEVASTCGSAVATGSTVPVLAK